MTDGQGPETLLTDRGFARVLGQEIRHVREAGGWTRLQLVARLPSGIGDRTLLTYEHGIRYMTVMRFVEICRAMNVSPSAILHRALEKVTDLSACSFMVDLNAIVRDRTKGFEAVRVWAARRRQDNNGTASLLLTPAIVREIAAVLGLAHHTLATYLTEFASELVPEKE